MRRNHGPAIVGARIIFDLDGTLIDSAPDIQGIANSALAAIGVAPISLLETHSFIGEGIQVFVQKMRQARGVPDEYQDNLLSDLITRYDNAVELTVMYPGVPEALTTLSRTHRIGICTNKLIRPCIAVLKHLQIKHHFHEIWGGDNPLGRKPNPAALLAAFQALGDGPRIFVGDSEVDAETASRAEVPFILFAHGYRKSPVDEIPHTVLMENFDELPAAVERIMAAH